MHGPDALATLRRLYAFNWDARAAIIHAIGRLPWTTATKADPPEKRSVVDAALDILETEAYWAHYVLDGQAKDVLHDWKPYDRSNVTSAERLAMHAAGLERATAERLSRITSEELARPRRAPEGGAWTAGDALLKALTGTMLETGALAHRLAALGAAPVMPVWKPSTGRSDS